MTIARFQMPDGRIARFEVPEGTSPEQAQSLIEKELAGLGQKVAESPPDITERIAGHPVTRFVLGAASPVLGAVQLGAEILGSTAVTEHLKRLEEMKRKGMGKDAGIDFAGIAGTILSPAVLGAMKIPAAATVLGRAGQGVAIGAGLGATTPITEGDNFAAMKAAQLGTGAVIGGVIPPAIEATRKVYQVGRNILDPLLPGGAERGAAKILAEAAGPKRAAVEAELSKPQVLVPGSQPTAAEAAARAGSPEFSALQQIAREHKPSVYSDIGKAQETARLKLIHSFAKDKAAVTAAELARRMGPGREYEAIGKQIIEPDKYLELLSKSPAFKAASSRAQEIADNAAAVAKAEGKTPIPFAIKDDNGKIISYSAQGLQHVKSVLDEMAESPTLRNQLGISGTEGVMIGGVRKSLIGWMNKNVTGWENVRKAYAAASKPINEMVVGQELEKALMKPIGEGERAGVFAGAVQEAPRTIKRATGQSRFNELDEVLQPANLTKTKAVLADLARKEAFERLVPLGRSKAAQIAQPFGLPATGPLHQSYMIFKTILGRVSKGINEKTLDTMADALQLPSSTLKLLQRAPTEKQAALIDQIIAMKLGRGAIAAGTQLSAEGMQQ